MDPASAKECVTAHQPNEAVLKMDVITPGKAHTPLPISITTEQIT